MENIYVIYLFLDLFSSSGIFVNALLQKNTLILTLLHECPSDSFKP